MAEYDVKKTQMTGLSGMAENTIALKRKYDEAALANAVIGEPIEDFNEWIAKNYPDKVVVK